MKPESDFDLYKKWQEKHGQKQHPHKGVYEEQVKQKNCIHCGWTGMCQKYRGLDRIKLYISLAGMDIKEITAQMGKDCKWFEYHLNDKFNRSCRTR